MEGREDGRTEGPAEEQREGVPRWASARSQPGGRDRPREFRIRLAAMASRGPRALRPLVSRRLLPRPLPSHLLLRCLVSSSVSRAPPPRLLLLLASSSVSHLLLGLGAFSVFASSPPHSLSATGACFIRRPHRHASSAVEWRPDSIFPLLTLVLPSFRPSVLPSFRP